MTKIKICHIITKLELGGAQQNTLYTVGHLNSDQFEASLITGQGGILDAEAHLIKNSKIIFLKELVRQISPIDDVKALFKLINIIKELKPDIVHTHSSKAGILGRWAARFAGVPVIVHTYHGFGFHDFQGFVLRNVYVLLEKLTAPFTDKFIAVSIQNIYKGLLSGIGPKEKYILIRSGIKTDSFKNCPVKKEDKKNELGISKFLKIVSTVGPFKPQKNLEDFVVAAKKICEKRQDTVFLIAGDGLLRQKLESLIEVFGLKDRVMLLGWRKDIAEILSITDVFVMTSLWEGLPRSIVEAMCCSVPIVANSIDGVKEVVRDGENGFLVKPKDAEATAQKVLKLLSDEALAKNMGTKGSVFVDRQFDIDFMVRQQEELYHELIKAISK